MLGYERMEQANFAVLEMDGTIFVIPRDWSREEQAG